MGRELVYRIYQINYLRNNKLVVKSYNNKYNTSVLIYIVMSVSE